MPSIAFAVPVYEQVDAYTFGMLTELYAAWGELVPPGWKLRPCSRRGGPVDVNRDWIAQSLLYDLGEDGRVAPITLRAADVIVWNDSDCYLPSPFDYVRLIQTLLDAPEDVAAVGVSFPCQTDGQEIPNFCPLEVDGRREMIFDGKVREIEWCGFGVIATRAAAFHAMTLPYFKFAWEPTEISIDDARAGGARLKGQGEDAYWCKKARDLGFGIYLHTGIRGQHSFRAPRQLERVRGETTT